MSRPEDLPEYAHPPLNEVTVGVQFSTPTNYSQLHAGGVWNLFRQDYPHFEEHEPLPPTFELFGANAIGPTVLELLQGPRHDRFWFVNEARDELIQFQNDRIHFNWKVTPNVERPYPRFEHVLDKFSSALSKLSNHFESEFGEGLNIVQAEVAYINHFPEQVDGKSILRDQWVNFVDMTKFPAEDVGMRMRYPMTKNDEFVGRVNLEFNSAIKPPNERISVLTITVRGNPDVSSVESVNSFLNDGHNLIVRTFDTVTTDWAHNYWNRKI